MVSMFIDAGIFAIIVMASLPSLMRAGVSAIIELALLPSLLVVKLALLPLS
jgi:hypothetical protein